MFVIAIDLSNPTYCLRSLKKWVSVAQEKIKTILTDKSSSDGSGESKSNPIEYPVVVVGCKSDILQVSDKNTLDQISAMQGKIRAVCLEKGCSLVYTSAKNDINCSKLKKFIVNQIYPEVFSMADKSLEVIYKNFFLLLVFYNSNSFSIFSLHYAGNASNTGVTGLVLTKYNATFLR